MRSWSDDEASILEQVVGVDETDGLAGRAGEPAEPAGAAGAAGPAAAIAPRTLLTRRLIWSVGALGEMLRPLAAGRARNPVALGLVAATAALLAALLASATGIMGHHDPTGRPPGTAPSAGLAAAVGAGSGGVHTVSVYLAAPDPEGLRRLADTAAASRADRAAQLARLVPTEEARADVASRLTALGMSVTRKATWSVTATATADHVHALFGSAREVRSELPYAQGLPGLPASLRGLVTAAVGGDETRPAFHYLAVPRSLPGGRRGSAEPAPGASGTPAASTPAPSPPAASAAIAAAASAAEAGIPDDAGLHGPQLRAAYAAPKGPDAPAAGGGPAPTVAAIELSGWDTADLTRYALAAGLPDPLADGRFQTVGVGRTTGYDPARDGDGDTQAALDAQAVLAVAPRARQRAYIAPNTAQGFLDVLDWVSADAADPQTNIVSLTIGWALCESYPSKALVDTAETLLTAVAAAGVTTFAGSGDGGSDGCGDGGKAASYPASSTSVVAVGGTTLLDPDDDAKEIAWARSGGGCSALFGRPGWQPGGGTCDTRAVPDLALVADPATGMAVHNRRLWDRYGGSATPGWSQLGGTGLSASLAAGLFAASWPSADAGAGAPPAGGWGKITGRLYAAPATAFRDVTDGSNGHYQAGDGPDLVTGRGAPLWKDLAASLAPPPEAGPGPGQPADAADAAVVAAAGTSIDGAVWLTWSAAADRPELVSIGGTATAAPSLVTHGRRVFVVVGGSDRNLWVRLLGGGADGTDDAGSSRGWVPLGPGGTRCFGQAAIVSGSTLHVGCRGEDGALYVGQAAVPDGGMPGRVSGWARYGGASDHPPAVATIDGEVFWFVTGRNRAPENNLYRRTATTGWTVLPARCAGPPGAGTSGLHVYLGCRDGSGGLTYAAAPLSRFTQAGGQLVGAPAFAVGVDGSAEVVVAGADGALYRRRLAAAAAGAGPAPSTDGGGPGWTRVGGRFRHAATAVTLTSLP